MLDAMQVATEVFELIGYYNIPTHLGHCISHLLPMLHSRLGSVDRSPVNESESS
jgi:hypothetical protein